ncbi:hypothetical protein KL918_002801 [Ogataea parapolymorpha]|uniref:Extracellular membrane protein CFEM domain-containing protein n=1 Tax=Ogataea parapolymorpha (strain ATCC 26012 / BCRC 20466 / JCM 22074 / NRRL Y-7560 / DL-1) TaxID=871575 RepID=W1QJK3_OGAPD|nr:hypothetical protein HPODL_00562 [Ogataea parapolymorpha DL-1]ESX01159.1 hypothetical protein HPODL_00562 [Ogataea parapolymorpha DL-1]KAG7867362.1 hypothetical protein KL918_002801 [Ogataea parapolymorpha]KAG7871088.1 hypothetical protein KL916_004454 [Ogataea parapolymorpha]
MYIASVLSLIALAAMTVAMPPACTLACVNDQAHLCAKSHLDFSCLCASRAHILRCLIDKCPFGNYLPARDHYLGTCIERIPALATNPLYNIHLRDREPPSASSHAYWIWDAKNPNSGVIINGTTVVDANRSKNAVEGKKLPKMVSTGDFFKDEEKARDSDSKELATLEQEYEKMRHQFSYMRKQYVESEAKVAMEQHLGDSLIAPLASKISTPSYESLPESNVRNLAKEEPTLHLQFATQQQLFDSRYGKQQQPHFATGNLDMEDMIRQLDDALAIDSSNLGEDDDEDEYEETTVADALKKGVVKKLAKSKKSKSKKMRAKSKPAAHDNNGLAGKKIRFSSNIFRTPN